MKLAGIFQDLEHLYDFQTVGYGGHFVGEVKPTQIFPALFGGFLSLTSDFCS